jgi:steroid 5-alpha reductase family enzyme
MRVFARRADVYGLNPLIHMTIPYPEAHFAIALSLSVLLALAWAVQQRGSNSRRVDTIPTFLVGLVGQPARSRPRQRAARTIAA